MSRRQFLTSTAGVGALVLSSSGMQMPPSEVAVHPAPSAGRHELYLLTDDLGEFIDTMRRRASL